MTLISPVVISALMALSISTLNTRGCSDIVRNLSVRTYIDLTLKNPDIVLLQETNNLQETSSCWSLWPHHVHCAPSDSRGTGVATLFKKKRAFEPLISTVVFQKHILYNKCKINDALFHVYNILVPQDDKKALECIQSEFLV